MGVLEIELFTSPGCPRCARLRTLVEAYAARARSGLHVRVVDVVAELDRAVELGVRATPALVVDGRLVLTGTPAPARLRSLLDERLGHSRGRRE